MQKQKMALARMVMAAALIYPAFALAQTGGGSSAGAHSGAASSTSTSGLASDQAGIPTRGTNSLGTANASDGKSTGTVGANMEPSESQNIDARIRAEDARVDAKIKNICRGC